MKKNIRYITDENGVKTGVIVPIEIWESLLENYKALTEAAKHESSLEKNLRNYTRKTGRKHLDISDILHKG